jgi:hypothetical protein
VKEEVEENQKASMLILCVITAMRRVTSSVNVNNGIRIQRKGKRSKFRDKMTVIVRVREELLE